MSAKSEDEANRHPLAKFTYNKTHELERKSQYEKLYNRTKEQIEEEKNLVQEYKRIENVRIFIIFDIDFFYRV